MSPSTSTTTSSADSALTDVRSVDRELLETLRSGQSLAISELTERLGVTATAVRQRVERMLEGGLVEREKVVAGRGRPTFTYRLTLLGHRKAGADHAELADAMWHEILSIPDAALRNQLLAGVARRLGRRYREQVGQHSSASLEGQSLEDRMQSLSEVLAGQRISADVMRDGSLPVLGFRSCPHPDLATEADRRAMCHLEEQMLSEALGSEVHLQSCRLDGDQCCHFAPVDSAGEPVPDSAGEPVPSGRSF